MNFSDQQLSQIQNLKSQLTSHSIYLNLKTVEDLKIFMSFHVFAVWDFMSLLKDLQQEITSISLPWSPSSYPKDLVRFINEIVLGEESDEDGKGGYCDHFTLYLRAMEEVGADTSKIKCFISKAEVRKLPIEVFSFTKYNLDLINTNSPHKVASAFFFGREDIIPMMFEVILKNMEDLRTNAPTLDYYLKRHIEIDGDSHGPLALKCLNSLCGDDPKKWNEAFEVAHKSLKMRLNLWNGALREITSGKKLLTGMDT